MEILNLLLVLFGYYFFYFLEFYQKILLIFSSCMFVSLLANHKIIENKSNDPDGNTFMYFVLNTIINCVLGIYSIFVFISGKIKTIYGFSHIYQLLKNLNYYFVQGRDRVISHTIQNSMNMLMNTNLNKFEPTVINTNNSINDKKTFENDNEMNNFLDSILDKKEN